MPQAITTRWVGPTNHRGARIVVQAQAGRRTVPWDHALGVDDNHNRAALDFALDLGWVANPADLIGGGLPDGSGNAYVIRPGARAGKSTIRAATIKRRASDR